VTGYLRRTIGSSHLDGGRNVPGTHRREDRDAEQVFTVAQLLGRASPAPSGSVPSPRSADHDATTSGHDTTSVRRPRRWPWLAAATVLVLAGVSTGVALMNAGHAAGSHLRLTTGRVAIGGSYLATASGFQPGERVRLSWTGPTNGVMDADVADPQGACAHGPIIERDPPGSYQIVATGLSSGRVAAATLQVLPAGQP
jgi:hypothetical protein